MSISSRDQRAWWRDAVTYQIYIRSFADGNVIPTDTTVWMRLK